MQDSYRQIWASIADAIKPQVSSDTFQRWFAAIDLVRADEQEMTLRVPNTIHQLWIESNYMPMVQSAVMGVLGAPRQMKFVFAENDAGPADRPTAAPVPQRGRCGGRSRARVARSVSTARPSARAASRRPTWRRPLPRMWVRRTPAA